MDKLNISLEDIISFLISLADEEISSTVGWNHTLHFYESHSIFPTIKIIRDLTD
tara:strand:- start:1896 stop:2057 length:162 start_codon:yes stop_codon:yes gene_type:complete